MLISHCFVVPYDGENHINNAVDGFRLVDYTGILKLISRREIVKLHLENGFIVDTIIVGVCVATNEMSDSRIEFSKLYSCNFLFVTGYYYWL